MIVAQINFTAIHTIKTKKMINHLSIPEHFPRIFYSCTFHFAIQHPHKYKYFHF